MPSPTRSGRRREPHAPPCPGPQAHVTRLGHPSCKGHKKTGPCPGAPCPNSPNRGELVCRMHGSNGRSQRKARKEREEAKARKVMAKRGLPEPINISHIEAMSWLVSAKYAETLWLRTMVSSIPEQNLVWGVTREKAGVPITDLETGVVTVGVPEVTREARPNVWLGLLHEAERDLRQCAKDAHGIGIDDAHLELAKEQGALLKERQDGFLLLLYAALVAAGVTGPAFEVAWVAAVADVLPRYFRGLGGSAL